MRRVHPLDNVSHDGLCPGCGKSAWIVDVDPIGKTGWLLCLLCDDEPQTLPLPADVEVIWND